MGGVADRQGVVVRLGKDQLAGPLKLPVTAAQLRRAEARRGSKKGMDLKLSKAQLRAVKSGGFLPALAALAIPALESAVTGAAGALGLWGMNKVLKKVDGPAKQIAQTQGAKAFEAPSAKRGGGMSADLGDSLGATRGSARWGVGRAKPRAYTRGPAKRGTLRLDNVGTGPSTLRKSDLVAKGEGTVGDITAKVARGAKSALRAGARAALHEGKKFAAKKACGAAGASISRATGIEAVGAVVERACHGALGAGPKRGRGKCAMKKH